MSDGHIIRTIGLLEDSRISEAKMNNNNTMMSMVKTMAMSSRQVSISESVALDGGSIADVFTITGGYILIEAFMLFLTEVVSGNACTMAWGIDPTTGAADIPIGTALDINAYAVGDMIWAEGDGTALEKADNATNSARGCITPILGPPGGIDMDMANSDPTTGIADVIMIWTPLSADAYVTVA